MRLAIVLATLCCCKSLCGQQSTRITGQLMEKGSDAPISNAIITLENTSQEFATDSNGEFEINVSETGEQILRISALDFISKRFSVYLNGTPIDLGIIYLERDIAREQTDNLISLTDGDLSDDFESVSSSMGLLQSTRDVFLNRAAFDFGQAFFKVRGYDSRNGQVLINGVPMNKFFDGRPQWNNWGGLNDVVRNQEFTNSLTLNPYTFGGILGNTNINTRPSGMRPGLRLSSSLSNRTYRGRLMATYNSGEKQSGLAYSVSASRRWAKEGFVEGTLYDAYSFFGAVEYQFNPQNSLTFTSMLARNRRGRSSALTEEVFHLMGGQYNPYWGEQDGKIRNSREREIFEPLFLLNYTLEKKKLNWNIGIAYQTGINSRSRLGYYNAPNPDPTYYRYLPSYHINSSIGADFINANLAKEAFLENPQLNWEQLYTANANNGEKAAYLLYDDVAKSTTISGATNFNYSLSDFIKLGFGGNYKATSSENYAEIQDLLGAGFHEDMDTFSNTLNDVDGDLQKSEGEKFNYHYNLDAFQMEGFAQVKFTSKKWNGFVSASYSNFNVLRDGFFKNERYLENSFGTGEKVSFSNLAYKGGSTYFLTGRHWFTANAAIVERPPIIQNIFINPRENNETVPELQKEVVSSVDLSYFVRLPSLTGRISAFYTRFQHTTDINFFFVDSGLGSDFVQEVITGLDRLHRGIEFGFEYEASSSIKLTAAGNVGHYVYASDPSVQINFDTASAEEDLIAPEGNIDLGIAALKDLKLAQGPQTALALGVSYRAPKYWWISGTTNFLTNNYSNLSIITRTSSFLMDPETGEPFPDASDVNVSKLLKQNKLDDIYLLNLVGGKSWLINGKYISFFASINNVFDTVFRTGGYEQSRNGNYGQLKQDNQSGSPSFAPKYWYSYGRTYFLNLAISF
ncbi:TonB-dependent receptor [Allomuricauda ruestringensis DSM 13258]|uniref:TonB-dependent receptor n=1 Tax=Allomuricauda ruestringensis (strain DSM 13258 / CIP 107369 / LMG 19739 / B1) TaxID=886377 RepID=G2PMP5_ALLRU|nr:TonB-dependent receptor [Allomuricauda ruestringensis]AEM70152.1 TonB-dependent receptor [Allomuricauda ruestringensis DSM 13258]